MAILVYIETEILCLSCQRRLMSRWKSWMACTHIIGIWKFLRIGTGVDKVKAAFCTPWCSKCMIHEKGDIEEKEIEKIWRASRSKLPGRGIKDIEAANDIVIFETDEMAKFYLDTARPEIEVGRKVFVAVKASLGWSGYLDSFAEDMKGGYTKAD